MLGKSNLVSVGSVRCFLAILGWKQLTSSIAAPLYIEITYLCFLDDCARLVIGTFLSCDAGDNMINRLECLFGQCRYIKGGSRLPLHIGGQCVPSIYPQGLQRASRLAHL